MRVIISDCDHISIDEEIKVFRDNNIEWELLQCKTEDELITGLRGHSVVINQYAPFTKRVFQALPDLKMIVRYGVGVNNIDVSAASKHGVTICNVPDYGVQEVASHAFAMSLCLLRKIIPLNEAVHNGIWDYTQSIPIQRLNKMTYGVVGLGRIGSCFAEMIRSLGGRVIATETGAKKTDGSVEIVDFDTLLVESDLISIHSNLETSKNLFDLSALERMKRTAFLVNVSRGGIVNEDDLIVALQNGLIAGAALDVAVQEPLPASSSLRNCPNLILTPHMAWYSEEASSALKTMTAEEAVRYILGKPLRNPVNIDMEG